MTAQRGNGPSARPGAAEVFRVFLRLGLTSFGGPMAHIGYFRNELVLRRRWIDDAAYAELVALCQFLPGPASSQTGFALGLLRAGPLGGFAAWTAFTLPSALLMVGVAQAATHLQGPLAEGVVHGLKMAAVAIVAQALWGMARVLTPDSRRIALALVAGALMLLVPGAWTQVGVILAGALAGLRLCRAGVLAPSPAQASPLGKRTAIICLTLFLALLIGLPAASALAGSRLLALFDLFYRAGALVFGGGHVVLPLLHESLVPTGWLGERDFLAGYGAAQALPGPLFAFSAYLGWLAGGAAGAALALVAIFLPGLLLVTGALPFRAAMAASPAGQAAVAGANAAVVGVLAAALYDPVWTGSIATIADALVVAIGTVLLLARWVPPLAWVGLAVLAGMLGA